MHGEIISQRGLTISIRCSFEQNFVLATHTQAPTSTGSCDAIATLVCAYKCFLINLMICVTARDTFEILSGIFIVLSGTDAADVFDSSGSGTHYNSEVVRMQHTLFPDLHASTTAQ